MYKSSCADCHGNKTEVWNVSSGVFPLTFHHTSKHLDVFWIHSFPIRRAVDLLSLLSFHLLPTTSFPYLGSLRDFLIFLPFKELALLSTFTKIVKATYSLWWIVLALLQTMTGKDFLNTRFLSEHLRLNIQMSTKKKRERRKKGKKKKKEKNLTTKSFVKQTNF